MVVFVCGFLRASVCTGVRRPSRSEEDVFEEGVGASVGAVSLLLSTGTPSPIFDCPSIDILPSSTMHRTTFPLSMRRTKHLYIRSSSTPSV